MSFRNSPKIQYRRRIAILVALPLTLNALLYLAYRDWSLWCFRWVEWSHAEASIGVLRDTARALPTPPEWVRFSLASGFWIFGVVSFLLLTWSPSRIATRRPLSLWVGGLLAICVGSEALQALSWIPGTADWSDVLAYGIGGSLALCTAGAFPRFGSANELSRPNRSAHAASFALVAFALFLATGAIYEGAMAELVADSGLYK